MRNAVGVVSLDVRFKGLVRGIEDNAHFFLDALGGDGVRVEIYLVGNPRMRKLNREHRGKDISTNVLAFNAPENFPNPSSGSISLGEVYLCPPYIWEHGEDINYLLLHGLLHVFGFNHENKSDRIKMEKLEQKLMKWPKRKF